MAAATEAAGFCKFKKTLWNRWSNLEKNMSHIFSRMSGTETRMEMCTSQFEPNKYNPVAQVTLFSVKSFNKDIRNSPQLKIRCP